jgi:hypothetical protein
VLAGATIVGAAVYAGSLVGLASTLHDRMRDRYRAEW